MLFLKPSKDVIFFYATRPQLRILTETTESLLFMHIKKLFLPLTASETVLITRQNNEYLLEAPLFILYSPTKDKMIITY